MTIAPLAFDAVDFSWAGHPALREISFTVPENCVTVVTGPAGSGKSTLLRLLATLESDYRGAISHSGRELHDLTKQELKKIRQEMGVVLNPLGNFDWLSAEAALQFVLDCKGESHQERVGAVLREVGLADAQKLFPREMSGGMQKRLALARAILLRPRVLLLDDPTAGLDPVTGREILDLIANLKGTSTIVFATSDVANVRRLADTVIFLVGGRILFNGGLESFLSSSDASVRQFLLGLTEGPIA